MPCPGAQGCSKASPKNFLKKNIYENFKTEKSLMKFPYFLAK